MNYDMWIGAGYTLAAVVTLFLTYHLGYATCERDDAAIKKKSEKAVAEALEKFRP